MRLKALNQMFMSYRIVFKGGLPDEFVDEIKGSSLSEAWEGGKLNGIVKINGNSYDGKAIKAIMSGFSNPDKLGVREQNMKDMEEERRKFQDFRKKMMALSPAERARHSYNLEFANMVWYSVKKRDLTSEERETVIKKSEEWITAHPEFHAANPSAYLERKDLPHPSKTEDAVHIGDLLTERILVFADKVLNA